MVPSQTPKEILKNVIPDVIVYHREQEGKTILRSVEKQSTIIGKNDVGIRCNHMIHGKLNSHLLKGGS